MTHGESALASGRHVLGFERLGRLGLSGISEQPERRAVGLPIRWPTWHPAAPHQRAQCVGACEFRQRLGDHRRLQRRPYQLDQNSGAPASLDTPFLFHRHRQAWPVRRGRAGLLLQPAQPRRAGQWLRQWWRPRATCRRCSSPTAGCRAQTPETDLQLGYVTSFLDGALALQANAAYQMNYQGQTGATSLSVLSPRQDQVLSFAPGLRRLAKYPQATSCQQRNTSWPGRNSFM